MLRLPIMSASPSLPWWISYGRSWAWICSVNPRDPRVFFPLWNPIIIHRHISTLQKLRSCSSRRLDMPLSAAASAMPPVTAPASAAAATAALASAAAAAFAAPRLGRRSLAAIKASQAVQQAAYLLTAFKRRYQCGWDTTPSKRFPERGASPREPRCRDTQQCRQAKRANAIFCRWMNIDVLSGKNAAGWSDAKLHFSICCTSRFVRTWRWVKNQANTALCTLGW